jgi:O-antigen/teichoic acid export membrane protein
VWQQAEWKAQLRLAWTMWTTGILGKVTFQFDDWLVFNVNSPRTPVWLGSGVAPEGLYSRAYNIGKMPMDVAAGMIGSIALSVYSEGAARGREVLQGVYRQITWILAWIIFFSSALAFAAAAEITHILLGDFWLPMVPLLQLMFLFIVGRPFFQNNSQLLQAIRQEKDYRWTSFVQAIFLILTCPIAVYFWGAAGASVAVSGMSIVGFVLTERLVTKHLGVAIWPTYLAPGLTCLGVIGLLAILGPGLPTNPWFSAIIKGVISVIAFGGVLGLFERKQARAAWQTLRQGLGRR